MLKRVVEAVAAGRSEGLLELMRKRSDAQRVLRETVLRLEKVDQKIVEASLRLHEATKALERFEQEQQMRENAKRKEIADAYARIVAAKIAGSDSKLVQPIPANGNDISIVLVRANSKDYIGKTFEFCGSVSAADYYNYGYRAARDTHYSFMLELAPVGSGKSDRGYLYGRRELGDDIVRILASPKSGDGPLLVRVKATILQERINSSGQFQSRSMSQQDFARSLQSSLLSTPEVLDFHDLFELLDWQFYDNRSGKWGPWCSEAKLATP